VENGTKEILKQAGFGKAVDLVEKGLCPICEKPVNEKDFKDELSRKEFDISGLCQPCQNKIFVER